MKDKFELVGKVLIQLEGEESLTAYTEIEAIALFETLIQRRIDHVTSIHRSKNRPDTDGATTKGLYGNLPGKHQNLEGSDGE